MTTYVTNRKRGYKVLRKYKTRDKIKLQGEFCEFTTATSNIEKNGYKFTQHKPATLRANNQTVVPLQRSGGV